jgi:hypothetical protein
MCPGIGWELVPALQFGSGLLAFNAATFLGYSRGHQGLGAHCEPSDFEGRSARQACQASHDKMTSGHYRSIAR